jgi:hypothetical protein
MEQIDLNNAPYVQICVTDEQKVFARKLVEHSLRHHRVSNIWDKGTNRTSHTRMFRFTGTLGEIIFADCYHLPRPTRSFGAVDGQDQGEDFSIATDDLIFSVDVKSMKRHSGALAKNYVLNIPASQLLKHNSKTTHYFCISFHQSDTHETIASLLGFIDKQSLRNGELGTFYPAGTQRNRQDNSSFTFQEDTYEIQFGDISPAFITKYLRQLKGFRVCHLR